MPDEHHTAQRSGARRSLDAAKRARERGDLSLARALALDCVAQGAEAWVLLGSLAHLEGQLDEAARCYRKALAIAPCDAGAHGSMAVVLAQQGALESARAHLETAMVRGAPSDLERLRVLRQLRELGSSPRGAPRPWERCAVPFFGAPVLDAPVLGTSRVVPESGLSAWTEQQLRDALTTAERIVAMTGAGISRASGLKTRKELWLEIVRDDAVSATRFRQAPEVLWSTIKTFWGTSDHSPNQAHRALAALSNLTAIITQNVDELHQRAAADRGADVPVLELHGSLFRSACTACDQPGPPAVELASTGLPRCECGAVLRPDVVLFGERLPSAVLHRAIELVEDADLLLVVGCAMDVSPAAELPVIAARSGATVVEIKRTPSRLHSMVPVRFVSGAAEVVLPRVCPEGASR